MKIVLYFLFAFQALLFAQCLKAQIHCHVLVSDLVGHYDIFWRYENNFNCVTSRDRLIIASVEQQSDSGFYTKDLFYRSDDGGETWSIQDPGLPKMSTINYAKPIFQVRIIDSTNVIALTDHYLLRTTDAGLTWEKDSIRSSDIFRDVSFSDSINGILVTYADSSLWLTSKGGHSWSMVPVKMQNIWGCYSKGAGNYRAFSAPYGPFYRTNNNWESVDSSYPYDSTLHPGYTGGITHLFASGGDTIFVTGSIQPINTSKIYPLIIRSTNGGVSWQEIFDTEVNIGEPVSLSSIDRDTIYAATSGGLNEILVSFDHGAHWRSEQLLFDTNWNAEGDNSVAITPDGAFVGAFGSQRAALVLGRFLPQSDVKKPILNSDLAAYPNPAKNVVSVHGSALLLVTDALGRACEVRCSGDQLDVSQLPPGVYYVSDGQHRSRFVKE